MQNEKILNMNHINPPNSSNPLFRFLLCGTTYPNKAYCISRPASRVSCIEYIVSGMGHVKIGDRSFTAKAGDSYFLPEGLPHYYYADKDEPWEKIWVNFKGDFANSFAGLCGIGTQFHYPALDTSDLLLKLQHYAQSKEPESAYEQCSALLSRLFFRLSASLHSPTAKSLSPVQKMLGYIERNLSGPVTLEALAKISGKSASQAERLFRQEVGQSVYSYLLNRKMQVAKELLSQTGLSVKEIASYLSFSDPFYFSGLFHRKVGVSPSDYRKNIQSEKAAKKS